MHQTSKESLMDVTLVLLLVALSLRCGSCSRASYIFEASPKEIDAIQGRSAILSCVLKKPYRNQYTLSWVMDDENAVNSRRMMTGTDGQLRIDKIDKFLDAGEFKCVANPLNSRAKVYSDGVNFNIKWSDVENVVRMSPPSVQEILPGVKVVLKCNASGKPRPQSKDIHWIHDGKQLSKNATSLFDFKSTRLIISSAKLVVFDGVYSCCVDEKCSRTNYELKVRDKATPVLVMAPEDFIVPPKGTATFTCIFDAEPAVTRVQWSHGERSIKTKNQDSCRTCDLGNGTLLLKDVKDRFEGTYFCEATGTNGQKSRGSAELTIAHISMTDNGREEELLDPGENHETHCGPVDAEPPEVISWYKDGRRISEGPATDPTLVIVSARQSDEGEYKCVAINIAGNVSKIFHFRIKRKPRITSQLIRRTEKEGHDVTLNCPAEGVPDPSYVWYLNGSPLSHKDRFVIKGPELYIESISTSDSGTYKCVARNDQGEDSSSAKIDVEERLKIVDPRPSDVCVEVNKTAMIFCAARGMANAQVHWTAETDPDRYTVIEHGPANRTLKVLPNPKSGDRWQAHCVARDKEGKVESDQAHVTVSVGEKPEIVKPPEGSVVFEGRSVKFDCGIVPELELEKLYWTIESKNSTGRRFGIRDNSDSMKYAILNNGSFIVRNASVADSGMYACHYRACGFNITRSAELVVAERDGTFIPKTDGPDSGQDESSPRYQKVQTIALAAGGCIAYLSATIVIIIYCRRKRHVKKGKGASSQEEAIMMNGTSHCVNNDPVTTLPAGVDDLLYDYSKLEHVAVIGRGSFGEVLLSKAPGLIPDVTEDILVMVKKISPEPRAENPPNESKNLLSGHPGTLAFNREVKMLFTADHENIGRLLGVCRESSSAVDCFITEYLEWGILKLCLQASGEGKIHRFSKQSRMKMCCQIAAALEHLGSMGLCHLDVSARNCLISSKHVVKLSVLSLSKDGFEKDYCNHNGQLLPIRWLPPEVLYQDKPHSKSDVWSYGVTCWEIFSSGKTPFSDLSDEEFLQEMESENFPTLPTVDGSKRIASLITKCCQRDATLRPEFYQIVKKLQSVISSETRSKTPNENTAEAEEPLLSPQDNSLKDET